MSDPFKPVEEINPLKDDWCVEMVPEFTDSQLIKALHNCLDMVFEPLIERCKTAKLSRKYFNGIINEIKKRLVKIKPEIETVKNFVDWIILNDKNEESKDRDPTRRYIYLRRIKDLFIEFRGNK